VYDPNDKLTQLNDARSFYLRDPQGNCCYFPQGWADEIEDPEEPEPELYGYYPTKDTPNSPVTIGWCQTKDLADHTEVTEEEARKSHPALAEYLDAIDRGEDPD